MRHRINIVVAVLSMAAGAWQGTTAQTEQPGSVVEQGSRADGSSLRASLTLRGCLQKGQAPGTFVLIAPGPLAETGVDPAAPAVARPQDRPSSEDWEAVPTTAPTTTYELVTGKSELDLASLVGKRVEAHGTPERTARGATADDSPTAVAAAADSPGSTMATGTSGTMSGRSRVRLTAVRLVSGTCG